MLSTEKIKNKYTCTSHSYSLVLTVVGGLLASPAAFAKNNLVFAFLLSSARVGFSGAILAGTVYFLPNFLYVTGT